MDPEPPDPLRRLDRDLDAFDASRRKTVSGGMGAAADGYRMLGQVLGGVLGGVGFGWLADHFLHTGPWGLVVGLVAGSALSIFAAIRTASKLSARAGTKTEPAPSVPDDED